MSRSLGGRPRPHRPRRGAALGVALTLVACLTAVGATLGASPASATPIPVGVPTSAAYWGYTSPGSAGFKQLTMRSTITRDSTKVGVNARAPYYFADQMYFNGFPGYTSPVAVEGRTTGTGIGSASAAPLTTADGNQLVVALVSTKAGGSVTVTSPHLTWTRLSLGAETTTAADLSVWAARMGRTKLTSEVVTAAGAPAGAAIEVSTTAFNGTLDGISFKMNDKARSGATMPTGAAITPQDANSLVASVAYANVAATATVPAGQTIDSQHQSAPGAATMFTEHLNSPVSTSPVTLSSTLSAAPTNWAFLTVSFKPDQPGYYIGYQPGLRRAVFSVFGSQTASTEPDFVAGSQGCNYDADGGYGVACLRDNVDIPFGHTIQTQVNITVLGGGRYSYDGSLTDITAGTPAVHIGSWNVPAAFGYSKSGDQLDFDEYFTAPITDCAAAPSVQIKRQSPVAVTPGGTTLTAHPVLVLPNAACRQYNTMFSTPDGLTDSLGPVRDVVPIDTVTTTGTGTVTSPPMTVTSGSFEGGNTYVAYASTGKGQTISSVTSTSDTPGDGLVWTLVTRKQESGQADVSIWTARSAVPVTNLRVTANATGTSRVQTLSVQPFLGAVRVGASGGAMATTGAPTVSITTAGSRSYMAGVGYDRSSTALHTAGASQVMLGQTTDATAGTRMWLQERTPRTTRNTLTTVNDTAPTADAYALAAVEVIAAPWVTMDGGPWTAQGLGTVSATGITTNASNELLVAYVTGFNTQVTTVSGAGLTWTRRAQIRDTYAYGGVVEVWTAKATGPLSAASVTSTIVDTGYPQSLMVRAYDGASGLGTIVTAKGPSSGTAPYTTPTPTTTGSMLVLAGYDVDNRTSHVPGVDQVMDTQLVDDLQWTISWLQHRNVVDVSGEYALMNDTAPAAEQFDVIAAEILPQT